MLKHYFIALKLLLLCLFMGGAVFASQDMCRLNCTSEKCSTSEGFMRCVRTCHQSITPLMRRCVRAGLASGFHIPQELVDSYAQVIPEEHKRTYSKREQANKQKKPAAVGKAVFPGGLQRSLLSNKARESIKAMAVVSRKNLIERCNATKQRVRYFADMIRGTMFEGVLADIIYRIDVLMSHIYESPVVDAIAIDNAAECRAMGTVVEDILGKFVNSPAYDELKVQFSKDQKFGRKNKNSTYILDKNKTVSGPPINIPGIAPSKGRQYLREVLRPDVMAQIRKEVREEVYREMQARREREGIDQEEQLGQEGQPVVIKLKRKKLKSPEHVDLDE